MLLTFPYHSVLGHTVFGFAGKIMSRNVLVRGVVALLGPLLQNLIGKLSLARHSSRNSWELLEALC